MKFGTSVPWYIFFQLLIAYLRGVRPQAGLGREALAAQVTVEGPALGPLDLGVVIAQVLLQVRQLDERAATLRQVALVRALA